MPSPPPELYALIERFDRNRDAYRSGRYNEEQARVELINPLFEALGWDVRNTSGNAEAYKDVVHEDAVKVGSLTKAPDYSFRIGGARKFFLEAKKPATNIRHDPAPAYQLRRYAWSAKLPLSILTDFEELAVYDCRVRPDKTDKPSTARIQYLTYEQYLDRWDDLALVFSKDAILKGSFDKYAEGTRGKKGTAEVDDAFLSEIEGWRDVLARHLALRNPSLTRRELNYVVQATIDRIIFLRICEDRGIEPYGQLQALLNGQNLYGRLTEVFRRADDRYNSGLFHFHPEKGRAEAPDEVSLGLNIDDKVLKDIISRLYYPDSPYEFSVLPADILGQVYEQFLGKVIRLTPGHQAKVEDKPEVKKAGGVYYTPTYIVEYIVQHTLGKLLEGNTPPQVSTMRILDPACGSGSFLIVAYQRLLDWHQKWYTENDPRRYARSKQPVIYQGRQGEWRLTTAERKRILVNNIYGVDIDPQAVEVTKLSLLLKVLEGESGESLARQMEMFQERALPDLSHNIQCGNSLIGPDFYQSNPTQANLFNDEEERYRINAFDWEAAFPEVMKAGGFDAVIGNPPYGFHQIHADEVKPYFKYRFVSSHGSFENYFLFYEQSLRLLRFGGLHGFITPVTWLTIPSANSLRRFILDGFSIQHIAWLPELVFRNAQVNTLVSVICRSSSENSTTYVLFSETNDPGKAVGTQRRISQNEFIATGYVINVFEDPRETNLLVKLDSRSVPLGNVARPCSGYNPYEVGKGKAPNGQPHTQATVRDKPYHSEVPLDQSWKPEVVGRDLSRYHIRWPVARFVKYGPWLAAPRNPENFSGKRILVQEITGGRDHRIIAAYCNQELYHSRDVIPIKFDTDWPSPLFVLGVVNSQFIAWWHHRRSPKANKGLFPKVLVSDLERIPIPELVDHHLQDVASHDQMVALVERMLALHQELTAARTSQDKTMIQRQIEATDRQIDRLVYELYDLTDEEIGIVEGRV
jgi:predicted type IV restriction endonuclease